MSRSPDGTPSRTRRPRGFTLIELMVVVFIIGILVAITVTVIPRVYRAVRIAQTNAQLSTMAAGIQAYYSDFHAYPGPLPNDVLGGAFYTPARLAGAPTGNHLSSLGTTNMSTGVTTFTANGFDAYQQGHITGAENLVLGLLGGLQFDTTNGTAAAPIYAYNPSEIFPDGTTPAPKGAMNLGTVTKRSNAYIQVKTGDLSPSGSAGADIGYTDDGGRSGADSMIPEFLDKFSRPMPILYLRANVGTAGVVTYAGKDEAGNPAVYQYDLAQVLGYTSSLLGTLANSAQGHHGLQDVMPSASITNPVPDTVGANWPLAGKNELSGNLGANAFAYLKDPSTPLMQPNGTTSTTNATAHPRQKDAFILISPGPDGVYGTADDIVYPGGSVSQ